MRFLNRQRLEKVIWALLLVSLPVTSFPYFPGGVGGRTEVRPLALYPLAALMVLVVLPRLFSRPAPRPTAPLIAFGLVAAAGTVLAYARGVDNLIGVDPAARAVRMLVTLLVGMAFYFAAAILPQTPDDLRFSLRWLYIGMAVALLWGCVQVGYILFYSPQYFDWVEHVQGYFSVRGLFETRISGMTYEPSWFAEQITFLLMPWLFAAVLSGISAFRWRWHFLTVEALLLALASFVLLYTYSRTGYALWALELFLAFFLRPKADVQRPLPWRLLSNRFVQLALLSVVMAALVFAVGSRNNYFSRLWSYWTDDDITGSYLEFISVSQRLIYWETAYRLFEQHPWLGIGLGNYTFYFADALADRALFPNPELLFKLTPEKGRNLVVTPKNLFLRILAETGVLGAAAFLAFLIAVAGCVLFLLFTPQPQARALGLAGLLILLGFGVISFSVDSFALPNMWINFGLLTAAARAFAFTSGREA